jgi:transcriptional regulator with XRE-family HTH domain
MPFLIQPQTFADNLRYFRSRRSFTVGALAQKTGLTTSVIQLLESGAKVPTAGQLTRLASALLVKSEDLVLPRPPEIEYYESC